MTRRGRLALALGLVGFVVARLLGSKPLVPVAIGLVAAPVLGWLWVRLAAGPARLARAAGTGEQLEGDNVSVEVRVDLAGSVSPPGLTLVEKAGKAGERSAPLRRWHGTNVGGYLLPALRRGRYLFEDSRIVIEDAFGFASVELPVRAPAALLVYPRLVVVDRLFADGASGAPDGRRLVLRRPTGFDFHSVREYEHGESLRRVHWPSTAKRGELMVKELEDAPRDEVAVVLDAERRAVPGPDVFDVLVRVAGSVLDAHLRRGRRCALVVNDSDRTEQRVHSQDGDRRRALDLLAAVEPDGERPVASLLGDGGGAAARAAEIAVVTAAAPAALVEALIGRSASRRRASVVFVEATSFAPAGGSRQMQPALLRLQAAGIPVAVVRAGDDLAWALSGAHGKATALA